MMSNQITQTFYAGDTAYDLIGLEEMAVDDVAIKQIGFSTFPAGLFDWQISPESCETVWSVVEDDAGNNRLSFRVRAVCQAVHKFAEPDDYRVDDWIGVENIINIGFPNDRTKSKKDLADAVGKVRYLAQQVGVDNTGNLRDIKARLAGVNFSCPIEHAKMRDGKIFAQWVWSMCVPLNNTEPPLEEMGEEAAD